MKIYTKTGDRGQSGLFGGQRVTKNHPRLEAYGTLDELNSYLGLMMTQITDQTILDQCIAIQRTLFSISAALATPNPKQDSKQLLAATAVEALEQSIDTMTADLPALKNFVLPGGALAASQAHVARTICRRAERIIVTVNDTETIDPMIIKYINRLSDWLFTLARWLNLQAKQPETLWQS